MRGIAGRGCLPVAKARTGAQDVAGRVVEVEKVLRRIIGRMRAGNADLQEEGFVARIAVEPHLRQFRHEIVGVQLTEEMLEGGPKYEFRRCLSFPTLFW